MKRLRAILFVALCVNAASIPASALTPAMFAIQRFGSAGDESGRGIAIDPSGNIVIVGSFTGTASFGGSALTSAGGTDIVVMSYTARGVHRWSQRFGGANNDAGVAVAVDASGNVFVTGQYSGAVSLGGAALSTSNEVFLAKYDRDGTHQWSQSVGSNFTPSETARNIAVDPSGNVFLSISWTDISGIITCNNEFSLNFRVFKVTAAGASAWNVCPAFTGTNGELVFNVDQSGNLFLAGSFVSNLLVAGQNLVSAGSGDIFVAKYDASGTGLWARRYGSTLLESARGIAIDPSGNIFLTGIFLGTFDMGGGPMVSAGNSDIFLCRLDSEGFIDWSRHFGGPSGDVGSAVRLANDQIFLAGAVGGNVSVGGDPLVNNGSGLFVSRYESNGTHVWSEVSGISASMNSFAADATGKTALTSSFTGTVWINGDPIQSAGGSDMIVARYAYEPAEPVITSIDDIGNDQGRLVKIRFDRSGYDNTGSTRPIRRYDVFRRDDPPPGVLMERAAARADGWTQVATISPYAETTYGADAPTIGDSTLALGPYLSVFSIRAATDDPVVFFASPSASGYSLDNLAPGVPQDLIYNAGLLTWDESSDADFDFFTVYGSNTSAFSSATLIGYTVTPGKDTTGSPYAYYFATATDFAGNESKAAQVKTTSGSDQAPSPAVLSVSAYPNPFNPQTTIRCTLPARARVTLSIYDANGSRVRALIDEERAGGSFTVRWNGRTDAGHVASSGVYFVRLLAGAELRSYKLVLQK